jgi:hypothetical protein
MERPFVMHTIDDVLPLLGTPLNEHHVESLFGARGQDTITDGEPGHPEDRRHYYNLPELGLQFLIQNGGIITTIFFHMEGDSDVRPYAWHFKNGLNPTSTREEVLTAFGMPERSSATDQKSHQFAPGGWDRFLLPRCIIHITYKQGNKGVSLVCSMQRNYLQ